MHHNVKRYVGIDIGGTFTDACVWDGQSLRTAKAPSTPDDLVRGVTDALDLLGIASSSDIEVTQSTFVMVQGSTVATNALLERKGVRTAFITTAGFGDTLRIGRQNRPKLYDFHVRKPRPVIDSGDCFEVDERLDAEGRVLRPLDEHTAREVIRSIAQRGIENVAISLLFSFLDATHEETLERLALEAGLTVSRSSQVLPEFREFERASTTAVNAYVAPLMQNYLSRLADALRDRGCRQVRVMQSNGGQISIAEAGRHAVRTILSGPAGGVVAARAVGLDCLSELTAAPPGKEASSAKSRLRLIAYDMGGTSTDVSLILGEPTWRSDSVVDGWPVRVPMLDIHTIGAGGGSIAELDDAGVLMVGPRSAGADPGPACYGRSEHATVTDANVVLGRIRPEHFLAGRMSIDPKRSAHAIDRLAAAMNVEHTPAALGIIRIANANMERAIKAVSAERGCDPRTCMLAGFGGAGGLHACELAQSLGMSGVILPANAGVLSAYGMLQADIIKDYARTIRHEREVDLAELRRIFADMMEEAATDVQADGYEQDDAVLDRLADMRYRGQSHELTILVESLTDLHRLYAPFHTLHAKRFGYAVEDEPVEIVTLRTRCTITTEKPRTPQLGPGDGSPDKALIGHHPVVFSDDQEHETKTPFYHRGRLSSGDQGVGPAVIIEDHATTLVPPSWRWTVQPAGHLVLRPDSQYAG